MSVVLLFPTSPGPAVADMNYTVVSDSLRIRSLGSLNVSFASKVVLSGVLLLSLVWYYFPVYGGVHWFTGPVRTVNNDTSEGSGRSFTTGSTEKSAGTISRHDDI